ncbi:hypothetical protein TNIN_64691 [Trichonephila inaurata madagascariensis]|uniref:Uncharacterized protein n=1 Tax=Trichonephila inaurata madagascariensis TaxID=2747483 RepID=A0A8X6WP69_9ARAC|nr:hypothetical protein TNIN_64691 [Trichonephila inaurata madagascariensis]
MQIYLANSSLLNTGRAEKKHFHSGQMVNSKRMIIDVRCWVTVFRSHTWRLFKDIRVVENLHFNLFQ